MILPKYQLDIQYYKFINNILISLNHLFFTQDISKWSLFKGIKWRVSGGRRNTNWYRSYGEQRNGQQWYTV